MRKLFMSGGGPSDPIKPTAPVTQDSKKKPVPAKKK